MTIQEILEAHDLVVTGNSSDDPSQWGAECKCGGWEGEYDDVDCADHRAHVAQVLEEHMRGREAQLRQLIRDMTDPGACGFDHHGGCQEHGYLDLKPGELCPHAEAKQLLGDETNGRE